MKDALLKIIDSYIPEFDDHIKVYIKSRKTKNRCATEIADIVKAFVEWCVEAPLIVRTDHDAWEVYKNQEDYDWGDPYEEMDINDLFEYWYNEIREL